MDEGKIYGEARDISFPDYSGTVLKFDMPVQESALFGWASYYLTALTYCRWIKHATGPSISDANRHRPAARTWRDVTMSTGYLRK